MSNNNEACKKTRKRKMWEKRKHSRPRNTDKSIRRELIKKKLYTACVCEREEMEEEESKRKPAKWEREEKEKISLTLFHEWSFLSLSYTCTETATALAYSQKLKHCAYTERKSLLNDSYNVGRGLKRNLEHSWWRMTIISIELRPTYLIQLKSSSKMIRPFFSGGNYIINVCVYCVEFFYRLEVDKLVVRPSNYASLVDKSWW